MSETKFTPGPWTQFVYPGGEVDIMPAMRPGNIAHKIKSSADANLIAASPDMYEALEMIETYLDGKKFDAEDVYDVIKQTLAKARGES